MNSVNWGGEAYSHYAGFKLTWESSNGQEMSNMVNIKLGTEYNIHTSIQVAVEVQKLWTDANRKGPFVIRAGTSVGFSALVKKVEMSDHNGVWCTVPENGAAIMVPGNDGLAVWRS